MARPLLLTLPMLAALLPGCSCNQDYAFPEPLVLDEVVAPEAFGPWLSLGVAPDGQRLTLSYYDEAAGGFMFAVGTPEGDAITWVHERIDGYPGDDGLDRGDMGKYGQHVVAPDGTVWAAYKDAVNGGVHAAHRLGPQTWEITPVEIASGYGDWISLDLDASGSPVIAHHDRNDGTLRVCHLGAEAAWACAVAHTGSPGSGVDADGNPTVIPAKVGEYARLVIHDGVEHIAFYDAAQGALGLLEGNEGSYTYTEVDNGGDVGQWPALYFDDENKLFIAYHDVGDQHLMLAVRDGGSWSRNAVDQDRYVGADSEFFVNPAGDLSILYFDGFHNDLKVATRAGGAWSTAPFAGDGVALGFHNEVASVGGRVWTASYDYTAHTLFTSPIAAN